MQWRAGILIAAVALASTCGRAPEARQFEVRGQILSIDADRREVLVDHEDIPGFMPAMVMSYKVNDAALLEGKQPGDLITATLVVEEVDGLEDGFEIVVAVRPLAEYVEVEINLRVRAQPQHGSIGPWL